MALKHAVLGLLSQRRSYGYDIVQSLADRLGSTWQLSASSVYAALDQLEGEGLIRSCADREGDVVGGDRGAKRRVVFEATEEGGRAFDAWISQVAWQPEPVRSELYLKVAMARRRDIPALLETVKLAEQRAVAAREECLGEADCELIRGGPWQTVMGVLARGAALARVEAELHWLGRVRETLEGAPPCSGGYRDSGASTPTLAFSTFASTN